MYILFHLFSTFPLSLSFSLSFSLSYVFPLALLHALYVSSSLPLYLPLSTSLSLSVLPPTTHAHATNTLISSTSLLHFLPIHILFSSRYFWPLLIRLTHLSYSILFSPNLFSSSTLILSPF